MKLGLWVRLIWLVGASSGCGGAEFLVGVFPDGGERPELVDAGAVDDAQDESTPHPVMTTDGSTAIEKTAGRHDAGELAVPPPTRDAGDAVESSAPAADSGERSPPAGDAADESAPPPPALCCATPCSGSSVAAIQCGNGPAWDCAAGTCTGRACAVGAVCHWMGATCTGTVEVCP